MKVIIVGAGHAGIEAAQAVTRMGARAILVTIHLESIAQMSCNPAIGGIAKGHLVKEIDALGGVMPRAADRTGIHFKILNRSKGPAVRASRSQNDKIHYRLFMKEYLENLPGLEIYHSTVTEILVEKGRAVGVRLLEGNTLHADAVIVASGTFLDGKIYIGDVIYSAGRSNEPASTHLARNIRDLGFQVKRLKTGTPMRLHQDSIDWSRFSPQPGDSHPVPFSMFTDFEISNKIVCYMGHTTPQVGEVIRENLAASPLYSGKIEGIGPRYCPSIEDKIVKFPNRQRHHFYLEPEGIKNKEVYVNGLSSSLPVSVQQKILQQIPGLNRSVIMRPAYAIEYDSLLPTQLHHSLESKEIENLYFAGQVNGTSGYEEAAAQGLMAGINAVRKISNKKPFVLGRQEAYIGVLIDDLVTRGIDEPYRLFTSRAEYRLQLREDNAFERLAPYALEMALISQDAFDREMALLGKRKQTVDRLRKLKTQYKGKTHTLFHLLKMPDLDFHQLEKEYGSPLMMKATLADISYVEAEVKYEGYIKIQEQNIKRLKVLQQTRIPQDLDYYRVAGLSTEIRQKLTEQKPATLAGAMKIPGVTPAAINAVSIHLAVINKKKRSPNKKG
jgi:tRNA uridine 5-carboxymethylaminomethyl modification enzyme